MLLFSWVNFLLRQMRAARERPPANCWTMTISQPALQNSFGKLFVIIAALARKTILTARQVRSGTERTRKKNDDLMCVSSARIAGTIWLGRHFGGALLCMHSGGCPRTGRCAGHPHLGRNQTF